jgi:hypothetical protein
VQAVTDHSGGKPAAFTIILPVVLADQSRIEIHIGRVSEGDSVLLAV